MFEAGARRSVVLRSLFLLIWVSWAFILPATAGEQTCPTKQEVGKYFGTGSCSANGCHGRGQPERQIGSDIFLLNEYDTWVLQDVHSFAYKTLLNEPSKQISRILHREVAPDKDKKCLVCHALEPTLVQTARNFAAEGVGCENCHGASSGWFQAHSEQKDEQHPNERKWQTDELVSCGLVPIRDPVRRAEKCLECHLGREGQEVDHQMIAAGHPDLLFETDFFSVNQPPHWIDTNNDAVLWAVGQAVQLREALRRLERRTTEYWPEFAELDCFSCHHAIDTNWRPGWAGVLGLSLKIPPNWRQKRGYPGRTPGAPPWNSAHYAVLFILADDIGFSKADDLKKQLDDLNRKVSDFADPQLIAAQAQSVFKLADELVPKISRVKFEKPRISRLLKQICDRGEKLASEDTRVAEQTYFALNSLFHSYESLAGKPDKYQAVQTALDELLANFSGPSTFDPKHFSDGINKVQSALHAAGII